MFFAGSHTLKHVQPAKFEMFVKQYFYALSNVTRFIHFTFAKLLKCWIKNRFGQLDKPLASETLNR